MKMFKLNTIKTKSGLIARFTVLLIGIVLAGGGAITSASAQGQVRIISGGDTATSKSLILPLNKAAIIELPVAATDVLVSNPEKVDAIIRSSRRVYLLGMEVGQANAFFFDANNNQILNLEIRVERDNDALVSLYKKLLPESRIKVEAVNENVILRGTVRNNADAIKARDIAARFVGDPELVMNMISVREPGQVMLKVRIAEMQRRLVKQLGIDGSAFARIDDSLLDLSWRNNFASSSGALGGLSGVLSTPGFGNISDLDFQFDAFEQVGLVRVLAEPTLTAVSGEGANFLAGGEFPVPVATDQGVTTIEFKEFGVSLGFRPLVMSKGRINLKINTEVSEITQVNSFSVGTQLVTNPDTGATTEFAGLLIPGLNVRRVESVVDLPSGGSMAIAGLLQENMQSALEGVPGLKDTPILGSLFRSTDYQNRETELVIIVTPYLVKPTNLANLTDPTVGFVPPSDIQHILQGKLEAAYGMKARGVESKTLQGPLGFILD